MQKQTEMYEDLRDSAAVDLELSWSEAELPEHQRTKHVHRLHPYLGKFVPQLVEIFLSRHFDESDWVMDPFLGSGTTLVEASVFGAHSSGCDISAFNALLSRVKTNRYNVFVLEHDLREVLERFERVCDGSSSVGQNSLLTEVNSADLSELSEYLLSWYSTRALSELLLFRALISDYPESEELLKVVLSRAARSARMTSHFDLDFPKTPQTEPYYCRKHKRTCVPTSQAHKFIRRYTLDTIKRVKEYSQLRKPVQTEILHGDSRTCEYGSEFDGLITSPPYPGRIDYHEQHRYAFELLGLPDERQDEIGAAEKGTAKASVQAYIDDMKSVFSNSKRFLKQGALVVIVIDDARNLYGDILSDVGFEVVERRRRHVNRRTGRRQGEFFEEIILARA